MAMLIFLLISFAGMVLYSVRIIREKQAAVDQAEYFAEQLCLMTEENEDLKLALVATGNDRKKAYELIGKTWDVEA